MFNDYLPTNPTWLNCSFSLVLYLLMVVMTTKQRSPFFNRRVNIGFGWILIFVFFMFPFYGDDWFSYFDHIKSVQYLIGNMNNVSNRESLEPIYYYLIFALNGDYLIWRLVIFGSTVLLLYYTSRRLGINKAAFLYAFALLAAPVLSYARVSLALAMAFYGLSLFICPLRLRKIPSYTIGCILVIASVFFHKSALLLPFIVFIAYTFKITRVKIIFLAFLFLLFFLLLNNTDMLTLFLSGEDVQYLVSEKSTKYLSNGIHLGGIAQIAYKSMFWASYYLFAFLAIRILWKKKTQCKQILPYVNATIITISFASVFLFISNVNTFTLFYRVLNFASVPISIMVAYCIYEGIYRKELVRVTYLCVLSNFLSLLYSTYSAYLLYH